MLYYLLIIISFICLLIFDLLQIRKNFILRIFFSIIGYSGIVSVIFLNCFKNQIPTISPPIKLILIFFIFIFCLLLVYSLFIEINISPYRNLNTRKTYKRGTYSISRHPGFLWLLLLLITLMILYRNREFAILMLFIMMMNFILIIIEDIFIFPQVFEDYISYKEKTPFLLSLKLFSREKQR